MLKEYPNYIYHGGRQKNLRTPADVIAGQVFFERKRGNEYEKENINYFIDNMFYAVNAVKSISISSGYRTRTRQTNGAVSRTLSIWRKRLTTNRVGGGVYKNISAILRE